jgi:UDP-GlcNAc:undecaprenyl-phosphate GlcNAc-1-phosphate transferase
MTFPFNIYSASLFLSLFITIASTPVWIRICARFGLLDDPGHRKLHTTPIPLAGGFSVISGLILPAVFGFLYLKLQNRGASGDHLQSGLLAYGAEKKGFQLIALFAGATGMMLLGFIDDKVELRAGWKFSGQILVALLAAVAGVRISLFVPNLVFGYVITVLWIVTLTNAFNFMDNMNGLCAGLGAIGAWAFGWSAAAKGQYLVAAVAFHMFGALLGFLPFNYPRAKTFLGDAGSHLVGYWLSVLAILPHYYSRSSQNVWAVLSPLLILAVPLADMAWVVVLRTLKGQPFYVGDTNHLSHRLVRAGLSKSSAVAAIWLFAAIAGGAASWLFN